MLRTLSRKWWFVLANGLCIALLGGWVLLGTHLTAPALLLGCVLYWLVDGIQSVSLALTMRHARSRLSWQILVSGFLSITTAVLAIGWPAIGFAALVLVIAFWAMTHGASEILAAYELRKYVRNERLLYANGVVSIVFGVLLLLQPIAGMLFLLWLLGTFGLVRGALLVAFALEMRGIRRVSTTIPPPRFASDVGR